jgi:hypothetical protein
MATSRTTLQTILWAAWQPFRLVISNTRALIERAIHERKQVILMYKGVVRTVCPHMMKRGRDGTLHVLTWQIDAGWREFAINKTDVIRIRNGRWHTAPVKEVQL